MAHFILEYSDNLGQDDSSIQALFTALYDAAVETGLFPAKGVRFRAYPCGQYRMADGNPEHGFVHLEVKLGVGRTLEERKSASESFFEVLTSHFQHLIDSRGMAVSFEMKELEAITKFNKNNIQNYLQ